MSFKSFALPAVAIAGIAAGALLSPMIGRAEAEAAIDKAAIEKIVHDYIMNNPTVIMDSVDQYQRKTVRDKSAGAIKENADSLSKDDSAPFLGKADGDVRIVEFFDYNCGYCKKVFHELTQLNEKDKNVKIIFKDIAILGPSSEDAAKWALASHIQGKYFAFHKLLMEHKGPINNEVLEKKAKDAGLDVDKARKDVAGPEVMLQLEKNRALAGQLGVTGTPAFVIGEDLVPGAVPLDEMQRMVEEQRKKK